MSGGSMYYLYRKVEDAEFNQDTPERKAFAIHLQKVAKALHDIEWVDSCDYGPGDENEAIRDCIGNTQELVECLKLVMLEHRTFGVLPEKLYERINTAVTKWNGK